MRLNFHGVLKEKFGESFEIEASSIADAIEGFSRQVDWPTDMRVIVPGYETVEDLQGYCPDEIDLMPAMNGGAGKWTNILLGAAMIGLAFVTGGASIVAGSLVTSAIGASMLVGGAMMILQGVVGLFMKAPEFKTSEDPEASKFVAANKNTVRVGTPVTLAYGRIRLGGHWLSLQSDSSNLSHGKFPETVT